MKTYIVSYSGNSTKFLNFKTTVNANSEREAVINVYKSVLDGNYFPQEDDSIHDCSGNIIAECYDDTIVFDGGFFSAEEKKEKTYDVQFHAPSWSSGVSNKGFEIPLEEAISYIKNLNYDFLNENANSYFSDYRGGLVVVRSNEPDDEEIYYSEEIK